MATMCWIDTSAPADLQDGSGRSDKRDVILRDRLKAAAVKLNPDIPDAAIDSALDQVCDRRHAMSTIAANRELDGLIRDGVRIEFKDTTVSAAKALLKRLTEEKPTVLVQDWYKDSQTRLAVRDEVGAVLDPHLPEESDDTDLFLLKRDRVFELTLDLAINHTSDGQRSAHLSYLTSAARKESDAPIIQPSDN